MGPTQKTILLIEDDDSLRESLADLLSADGFQVVSAGTGARGVGLYQKERFNLVITDIYMPEIDGLAVIETLIAQNQHAKIIAMSAISRGSEDDLLDDALALGARICFRKPFDPVRFLAAVHALIGEGPDPIA